MALPVRCAAWILPRPRASELTSAVVAKLGGVSVHSCPGVDLINSGSRAILVALAAGSLALPITVSAASAAALPGEPTDLSQKWGDGKGVGKSSVHMRQRQSVIKEFKDALLKSPDQKSPFFEKEEGGQ
eukprot:2431912-Pyramimonas_sp.AAC.1